MTENSNVSKEVNVKEENKSSRPKTIPDLLKLIFVEIIRQKKWILLPLWVLLLAIALIFFISSGSYLIPAIYMAF